MGTEVYRLFLMTNINNINDINNSGVIIFFFNFKKGGDLNPTHDYPYASFLLSLVLHHCKFPFYILHHHSRDIPNSPTVVTLLPGIK